MLPQEMGCGSGMTCWRRLRAWQRAGVWQKLHHALLNKLGQAEQIDWSRAAIDSSSVAAPGGAKKPSRIHGSRQIGTKRHLVVDRQGIPLAVTLSAANVHDSQMMEATVTRSRRFANGAGDRAGDRPNCMATKATTSA